ncbi:hypothetical protein FJR06_18250 [Dolichospermum sp. UHCC 0352]|uniref:hypothetical protein n=1 Tax=Dolichospermum sp. UHCC 0352 TaxID=2590011 RepID=UPI00029B6987|nr:hypothetical protein ANA_C20059 [Anabaena sp. 90]MTJ23150.1 hypothetical protein [Dolichospermum sp. UHCC 0352]
MTPSCKSLNPGYPDSDNKNYVLDQNQKPIAVQIPMTEFEQIEEILENYGLAQLMQEVETDEILSKRVFEKFLMYK